jgi:CheY-like chemotaxis protein
MPDSPVRILIVDDNPAIRRSMELVLDELGYSVRSAAGGFAALREIRQEMPDILLTDLNVPGMSGTELLAIVWRRFPAIQKIAMGSVYPSNAVPSGVAADAFFQKSDGISELVRVIQTLPWGGYRARQRLSLSAPLRIQFDGHAGSSRAHVTIECPECLRTFSQPAGAGNSFLRETDCIHCGYSIQYSIVGHRGHARLQPIKRVTSATLRVEQN